MGNKMNKINVPVNLSLSTVDIAYINELIERDKAKPVKPTDSKGMYKCPTCGAYAYDSDTFCDKCGQRLDTENFAI